MAHIYGLMTLRPARHYKYYHCAQHRRTGDANLDPELQTSWLEMPVNNIPSYLLFLSGIPNSEAQQVEK